MGVYNSLVIPNEGVALLASVIATQGTLSVTEMRFSENDYTGQESTLTAATFLGTFVTATPSASVHDSTIINVTGSFTNTGFATDKTLRSIGIIGKDTNNVDTLIAVCTASSPDVIPVPVLSPSTYAYSADITVSSTDNITVSGSQAGVLFTADIVDNLTSLDTDKPLSARQGKVLKGLIDNISTAPDEESIVTAGGVLVDYGNKLDEFTEQTTAVNIWDFTNGYHFIDDGNASLDYSQLPVTAAEIGANLSWVRVIKDAVNHSYMAEYTLNDGSEGSKWVLPIRYESAPAPTASDWIKIGEGGSNPNLLINPWFTVNQRGVSSGSVGTTATYLMDMWIGMRLGSYSLTSNGFSFAWDGVNGTFGYLRGFHEGAELEGQDVTVSAIIDGVLIAKSVTVPAIGSDLTEQLTSDITLVVESRSDKLSLIFRHYSTTSHTIKAVKLEYGTTSTLAQDHAPNYTDELLRCQRYFKRFKANENNARFVFGMFHQTTEFRVVIPLPTPMRTTPTATYAGTITIARNATKTNVNASAIAGCVQRVDGCVELDFTTATAVAGEMAFLSLATSGDYIDLSSEF